MLHAMTPQQFDEWVADYMIAPWDGEVVESSEPKDESIASSLSQFRKLAGV